jgi:hypothetical protein
MNLYEIPLKLYEIMEIEDEELRVAELNRLELQTQKTFIGLINYIQSKESDFDAIDNEIKRLQDIKRMRTNRVDSLKNYIKTFMEANGIKRQDFPTFTLSVAKNPPSVEIYNENLIPEQYREKVITEKINKTAIKNDITAGLVVAGADIKQGTSLRIK